MFLLDTNVISELRKIRIGKADVHVAAWADQVDAESLYLSAISIQELEVGVLRMERRDPATGLIFRHWFNNNILPAFEGRILPVDTAVALRAAQLDVPDPCPIRDGLIAATALIYGMVMVTRKVADFERSGAKILNPLAHKKTG